VKKVVVVSKTAFFLFENFFFFSEGIKKHYQCPGKKYWGKLFGWDEVVKHM